MHGTLLCHQVLSFDGGGASCKDGSALLDIALAYRIDEILTLIHLNDLAGYHIVDLVGALESAGQDIGQMTQESNQI